jgi:hypothetical protein
VRPLEDMEILEIEGVLWRKAVPHKICRCEKCCFLMVRQSLAQRLYWLLAKWK